MQTIVFTGKDIWSQQGWDKPSSGTKNTGVKLLWSTFQGWERKQERQVK